MKKFGFSTLSSILCIAGASAIGVAGYTTFSGQTLCSVIAGCDGKTAKSENATAVNVSAKSAKSCSSEKACCSLAKLAKAQTITAADKSALTCKSACTTANIQARNLQAVVLGSAYPIAIPAAFYDRTASMDCSELKASGCCKSAKAVNAAATSASCSEAKSSCCKSGAKAVDASATEKSGCCKSGAKAVDASAKSSGCCKSKDAAAATAINASATQADEGCCKGSGKRADGKECCGKCPSKAGEKVADSSN